MAREHPEYPNIPQEQVAIGQLDTAIELWFHERDKASIHTLASAARGVLENIARERRNPRELTLQDFIKTKPRAFQDFMRDPQNYFKHGNPKPRGYHPRQSEVIILDSIVACSQLFGCISPLMALFVARISITDKKPQLLSGQIEDVLLKGRKIDDFVGLDRKAFFQKALPLILEGW